MKVTVIKFCAIVILSQVTLIRVKGDCYDRLSPATMMLAEGSISKSTFSKGDKCQWILVSPNYENMLLRIDIKHLRTYPTKHCTDGSYFILPNGTLICSDSSGECFLFSYNTTPVKCEHVIAGGNCPISILKEIQWFPVLTYEQDAFGLGKGFDLDFKFIDCGKSSPEYDGPLLSPPTPVATSTLIPKSQSKQVIPLSILVPAVTGGLVIIAILFCIILVWKRSKTTSATVNPTSSTEEEFRRVELRHNDVAPVTSYNTTQDRQPYDVLGQAHDIRHSANYGTIYEAESVVPYLHERAFRQLQHSDSVYTDMSGRNTDQYDDEDDFTSDEDTDEERPPLYAEITKK